MGSPYHVQEKGKSSRKNPYLNPRLIVLKYRVQNLRLEVGAPKKGPSAFYGGSRDPYKGTYRVYSRYTYKDPRVKGPY